ncbi:50S ribosomal protein L4 [Drechmeria coniospora]|uniref:Large ribosomal subunit protein uL29m n=1 Tax=Drechmeria coniospora TaxID=98403 RepID=A0A151GQN9_DRECN|nr:50S ribosomal protein L4 [Drechmeria coniospora]KYK59427.1 50S ribosomal protein L4 [Drechmeria coniospora]ODA76331.1 hypothetical protein RJ55_08177 [Drechmeria coniospora]
MAASNVLRSSAGRITRFRSSPSQNTLPAVPTTRAGFSTTPHACKRRTKDNNASRGVSSLYGSGPRENLSMSDVPLPKPRDFKPKIAMDENHGLWGFFPSQGKLLWTPKETEEHGRPWAVEELRKKSWEDLHALWWVCCKERNMLATSKVELARGALGFGEREIEMRDEAVQKSMRAIKHALTERYYTWQDAVDVAKSDIEIDLESQDGQAYKPSAYEDEPETSDAWTEQPQRSTMTTKPEKEATA